MENGGGGGSGTGDGVGTSEEEDKLYRIGSAPLKSSPSRSDCIDISPFGAILVRTDEFIHIVHIADSYAANMSPFDDNRIEHHRNVARTTRLYQQTVSITKPGSLPKVLDPMFERPSLTSEETSDDVLVIEDRFVDARWAPYEWGPLSSPIFAVLTTKRILHLFHAPHNQVLGPWKLLCPVNTAQPGDDIPPVSAFTWLSPSLADEKANRMWIVGGGLDGSLTVWRFEKTQDKIQGSLHSTEQTHIGAVYAVECSPAQEKRNSQRFLAVAAEKGLFVYIVRAAGLTLVSFQSLPILDGDRRITFMKWFNLQLLFCTSGEVHCFSADVASPHQWGVTLLAGGDPERGWTNFPLEAPAGIRHTRKVWQVTLKDGSIYSIPENIAAIANADGDDMCDSLAPHDEIEAPSKEIADVQRKMERTRGMFACKEDGCGTTFMCFDTNDIAAWSYLLKQSCQLDVAITQRPSFENDVHWARRLLQEQLRLSKLLEDETTMRDANDPAVRLETDALQTALKHRRSLLLLYSESNRKANIANACVHVLQDFSSLPQLADPDKSIYTLVQIAMMFASWLKGVVRQDQIERIDDVCTILLCCSTKALLKSPVYASAFAVDAAMANDDALVERQCLILAASALVATEAWVYEGESNSRSAHHVLARKIKGDQFGAKLVQEWLRLLRMDKEVDLGESCPACQAPVTIAKASLFHASCRNGHGWARCSTTRSLLTRPQVLRCVVCSRPCMLLQDATNDVERSMLQHAQRCTICGGAFVLV